MPYVIVGLCLVIVFLLVWGIRLCGRIEGLYKQLWQMEKQWRERREVSQSISTELRYVLTQIGKLLDSVAHTRMGKAAPQEALDLVDLGAVLRMRAVRFPAEDDRPVGQRRLSELGDRYGIEPDDTGLRYSNSHLVRLGEEILGRALTLRDSGEIDIAN